MMTGLLFVFFAYLVSDALGFALPISTRYYKNSLRMSTVSGEPDLIPDRIEAIPFIGTGCVLLSQPGEYDHYLIKSAILIFEHSPKRGTKGVVLDKITAFSAGEAMPSIPSFKDNNLYLGGNDGKELAIMIHRHPFKMAKSLGFGLYVGGVGEARDAIDSMRLAPSEFKFVFNHVEWGPGLLEKEIEDGRWDVCMMPPEFVLEQKKSNWLWARARNALRMENALRVPGSAAEENAA